MSNDFQKCPPEVCASLPASLAQQCKDSGFGPDHPVAVVIDKNTVCQCSCGDAVGAERADYEVETGETGNGIPDCPYIECEFDPVTIEACQGLPPGTSVILHSGGTDKCRCSCWGGKLAPYKVKNADGDFVALDDIPAGSFVAAAGRDLDWMNVPVRYATRPRQMTPQRAIRLKTIEGEMVVPRTHIFVTLQFRLIPAHRLTDKLVLLAPDGKGIPIEEIEEFETNSVFQFIATSNETPPENLRYHLLNSQGVVSGDYAVQRAYEARELPSARLAYPYPPSDED